jgi:hypothetical protein
MPVGSANEPSAFAQSVLMLTEMRSNYRNDFLASSKQRPAARTDEEPAESFDMAYHSANAGMNSCSKSRMSVSRRRAEPR